MDKKQLRRTIQILADCSTVVIVAIIFVLIFLLVHPFERGFHCNDDTIRYPYKADTIPLWIAGAYGVMGALFMIIMTELYLNRPCCRSDEDEYNQKRRYCNTSIAHAILIYTMGAMATLLITEIGKHTIGRPRPYFFTVCQPRWPLIKCFDHVIDGNGQNISIANYIPFSYDLCAGDPMQIKEARLSFPSGHSSFTVFSMMFIIIYLEARVKSQRIRVVKAAIQLICFIASWHTCMSRVSDHKHHYSDVIAGAIIGFSVATFSTIVMGRVLWVYGLDDACQAKHEDEENNVELDKYDNDVEQV